mgnify:CR=1 FL=1
MPETNTLPLQGIQTTGPMSDTSIRIEYRYTLDYPRDHIWEKLNDPEILASCIRGCTHVSRENPTRFRAVIRAHVGEIKNYFIVDLDVDDTHAPDNYRLSSVVSAGFFGKVWGGAEVDLKEVSLRQSELHYVATITGRGLLGKALPLVEGVAVHRVHEFFDLFVEHLA